MSAPETGHAGLDLSLDRPGGDGRVDGIAAGLEHAHADLGGQRMPGRDHALRAHHRGPPAGRLGLGRVDDERHEGERQEQPTCHVHLLRKAPSMEKPAEDVKPAQRHRPRLQRHLGRNCDVGARPRRTIGG